MLLSLCPMTAMADELPAENTSIIIKPDAEKTDELIPEVMEEQNLPEPETEILEEEEIQDSENTSEETETPSLLSASLQGEPELTMLSNVNVSVDVSKIPSLKVGDAIPDFASTGADVSPFTLPDTVTYDIWEIGTALMPAYGFGYYWVLSEEELVLYSEYLNEFYTDADGNPIGSAPCRKMVADSETLYAYYLLITPAEGYCFNTESFSINGNANPHFHLEEVYEGYARFRYDMGSLDEIEELKENGDPGCKVTVSFDLDGENIKQVSVDAGSEIDLPQEERSGYDFSGWYEIDRSGNKTLVGSPYTANTNTLLHAFYTKQISVNETDVNIGNISSDPTTVKFGERALDKIASGLIKTYSAIRAPHNLAESVTDEALSDIMDAHPGANVLTFGLDISVLDIMPATEEDPMTLTYSVTPWVQADENDREDVSNEQLNGQGITFRLPIPSSMPDKTVRLIHSSHSGEVIETLTLPVKTVSTGKTIEKYVEVTVTCFSFFEFTFAKEKAVSNTEFADPIPSETGTYGAPVTDGQWNCGPGGTWTYRTNGTFRNTWGYIANPYAKDGQHREDWFYFDENGAMVTGWKQIGGKWYYFNEDHDGTLGAMQTGWIQSGDSFYYLSETPGGNEGVLLVNAATPDGYTVDENGKRIR